jgi:hypothetical protein
MTTSQRLKTSLIAALTEANPDESIEVVDAKSRAPISLPCLAVDITAVEAHSEALQHVERVTLTATLRLHSGDDDEHLDAWIDQIETTLTDVSFMKAITSDKLVVYSWTYGGSSQEWDESIIEVSFSVEALCSRFTPQI